MHWTKGREFGNLAHLDGGCHFARLLSYASLVGGCILLEHGEGFALCWVVRVGIVEQILNAQQDLLDGDGRFPALVLVQDAKADGS